MLRLVIVPLVACLRSVTLLLQQLHLVSAINYFRTGVSVFAREHLLVGVLGYALFLFVDYFDGGHIFIGVRVSLKVHVVLDEEVHEPILLLWWQFTVGKCLDLRIGLFHGRCTLGFFSPPVSLSHFHSFRNKL